MARKKKEHSESSTNEYSFDFSNVDFETGEGVQLGFSSWEEWEAYMDAYDEEQERRKKSGLL